MAHVWLPMYLGGYCSAKFTPAMKPLTLGVPKDLLRPAAHGGLRKLTMRHAPMPMGRSGADTVTIIDLVRQPFDGLNKRIVRVSSYYVDST